MLCFIRLSHAQWSQKASLPGSARSSASSFVIGNKAYIIGGWLNSNTYLKDVWEYDIVTSTWTQKANFPGPARGFAVAFSINGIGYYGLGFGLIPNFMSDFWAYNPATDTWTQVSAFPDMARFGAVGFSVGSKGYVGAGYALDPINNTLTHVSDFWEYDPVLDTWTQKTAIPGSGRRNAVGISLNGKGYVGLGRDASSSFNDFYEYAPATDSWITKQSMFGQGRDGACVFTYGGELFVVGGNETASTVTSHSTCVAYNPTANTWSYLSDFTGGKIVGGLGVSFSNTAFIGVGLMIPSMQGDEWWQYTPTATSLSSVVFQDSDIKLSPNPASDGITLTGLLAEGRCLLELQDVTGKIIKTSVVENNERFSTKWLADGYYIYSIKSVITHQMVKKGKLIIQH